MVVRDRSAPSLGSARATLTEVAARAGVHPSTVSRVLDNRQRHRISSGTTARVLDAVRTLNYRPNSAAQDLRRGRSGMVGLAVASLTDPLIPPLLRAMQSPILEAAMVPIIVESNNDSATLQRMLDMLWSRLVDGLVMTCVRDQDVDLVSRISRTIPVVLAIRRFDAPGFHSIVHDDAEGAANVARHFAELGHRRVAQIVGPSDISTFRGRKRGFAAACRELNLDNVAVPGIASTYTVDEGDQIAHSFLTSKPGVTAIFAHNDAIAFGVVKAARAIGLSCPRDISIAGYNDAPLSDLLSPALTTVRVAIDEVGTQTGRRLLQLLDQPYLPSTSLSVLPELVVRESTGPVPAG